MNEQQDEHVKLKARIDEAHTRREIAGLERLLDSEIALLIAPKETKE